MDRATDIVGRATVAIAAVLPYVCDVAQRNVRMPKVYGGYGSGSGYGVAMRFLHDDDNGIVKVNIDMRWSKASLESIGAHELGHAAVFQANPELIRTQYSTQRVTRELHTLDEGIAECVQEQVNLVRGLQGKIFHLQRAMAKRFIHFVTPQNLGSVYTDGYKHVRNLRKKGIALSEIIEHPMNFLPKF